MEAVNRVFLTYLFLQTMLSSSRALSRKFANVVRTRSNTVRFFTRPHGKILAEYIWIGGKLDNADDLRSKTRTFDSKPKKVSELPDWSFDGSSTNQAFGNDSDVILQPVAMYPDPIRGGDNILVLCDCYNPDGTPVPTNNRAGAKKIMDKYADQKPWFGIEQEYMLFPVNSVSALGFPLGGYPKPQGPYYWYDLFLY